MSFNKVKWILGVLLVFFLILATNFIDRSNFSKIKDSVVNIYEDRLLAKGILFDISILINEKHLANQIKDSTFYLTETPQINSQINQLIIDFQHTKLVKKEKTTLEDLQNNLLELEKIENKDYNNINEVNIKLNEIKNNLIELSKIQLEEGRRQMFKSKKALDSVELLSQLEIFCLIFLAVIIQILIITGPKKKVKK